MWFTLVIIGIWVCATVGCMCTKDSEPFGYATVSAVLIGVGYLFRLMIAN